MEQKERTPLQNIALILGGCFVYSTITASAVQFVTDMSPLLEAYNWVCGTAIILGLFAEYRHKSSGSYPRPIIRVLIILTAIICLMSIVICYKYYDFLPEISRTFGSR